MFPSYETGFAPSIAGKETFCLALSSILWNKTDMTSPLTISQFRAELDLTLEEFAAELGLKSKGNASLIERGGSCSVTVALRIEKLSGGRIDASELNKDVKAARHGICNSAPSPTLNSGKPRDNSGRTASSNEAPAREEAA